MLRRENQVRYRNQVSLCRNQVLLGYSYSCSHPVSCLWLFSHYGGRVQQLSQRPPGLHSLKYLFSGPSRKSLLTLAGLCLSGLLNPFIWLSSFSVQMENEFQFIRSKKLVALPSGFFPPPSLENLECSIYI